MIDVVSKATYEVQSSEKTLLIKKKALKTILMTNLMIRE